MKKHFYQMAATLSSLALYVALAANGTMSIWIYHQPRVPAGLEKFRK